LCWTMAQGATKKIFFWCGRAWLGVRSSSLGGQGWRRTLRTTPSCSSRYCCFTARGNHAIVLHSQAICPRR